MKVLYFAWIRERTGVAEENIILPPDVTTVSGVIDWLTERGPEFEFAFENRPLIRAALDKRHVEHDTAIAGARELAFFPPMTGG